MADLSNFIYCLNTERFSTNDGNGEIINAMGILSALTPEVLPGAFSFSILFSLLNMDTSISNTVQVKFLEKKNNILLIDTGIVSLPPSNRRSPGEEIDRSIGVNISMDFRNIVFEAEGLYETEIICNGMPIGKCPIYVKGMRSISD